MEMLKVPQWIKGARKEDDDDFTVVPPPIATLPERNTEHDDEITILQRAAMLHAQLRRNIETAQVDLAEAVLGRQGDQNKITFLEKETTELRLEIAQLQTTIATLQSDLLDKDKFMSLIRQVLDRYEIKAPPKKERKAKPPKQQAAPTEAFNEPA